MKDKKLKVCFLVPSLKSGGIETYLLRFLQHQKENLDATVLIRNSENGELYDAYRVTGANIILKPLGYFNLSAMLWYFRHFNTEKFNTVCDFNANFAGLPMLLSKFAGIKKRITFYRQGSDHFKKSFGKELYNKIMNRLVYQYSTAIFANSSAGLEFFFPKEYPEDLRFKVIKNGINISEFLNKNDDKKEIRKELGLAENAFIIGHTGRFTEAKNHFFLLDVIQKLVEQDSCIQLVLIGNDTDQLMPYISQLGIEDNCTVLGYKNNISKYLKAFDLYFFPSVTEGQPNALIEAMISGLPIAASNISSIKECLPSDRQHCLINPYNIKTTVERLLLIKENPGEYIFSEYACKEFDAEIQFGEFMDNL